MSSSQSCSASPNHEPAPHNGADGDDFETSLQASITTIQPAPGLPSAPFQSPQHSPRRQRNIPAPEEDEEEERRTFIMPPAPGLGRFQGYVDEEVLRRPVRARRVQENGNENGEGAVREVPAEANRGRRRKDGGREEGEGEEKERPVKRRRVRRGGNKGVERRVTRSMTRVRRSARLAAAASTPAARMSGGRRDNGAGARVRGGGKKKRGRK